MEENLGNRLRRAREAAGLTVDDAVYRAKMPRAVVEALEADDFGFFTSPLYARSFLKQYGDYVGCDVTPWIHDLVPTALIDGEAVEAFIEIEKHVPPPVTREKKRESGGNGAMAAIWLVLITGGLIWGGMVLFRGFEQQHADAPPPAPAGNPVAQTEPPPVDAQNPAAVTEPPPEEAPAAIRGPEPPKRAIIVRDEE